MAFESSIEGIRVRHGAGRPQQAAVAFNEPIFEMDPSAAPNMTGVAAAYQ